MSLAPDPYLLRVHSGISFLILLSEVSSAHLLPHPLSSCATLPLRVPSASPGPPCTSTLMKMTASDMNKRETSHLRCYPYWLDLPPNIYFNLMIPVWKTPGLHLPFPLFELSSLPRLRSYPVAPSGPCTGLPFSFQSCRLSVACIALDTFQLLWGTGSFSLQAHLCSLCYTHGLEYSLSPCLSLPTPSKALGPLLLLFTPLDL